MKAIFDNKENALWPNQFLNVQLLLETRPDSIVVPAAIQRGPQGRSDGDVKHEHPFFVSSEVWARSWTTCEKQHLPAERSRTPNLDQVGW